MAEPEGYFWGNDPNINSKLRDRIAALMQRSGRGYPKTFGEGLSAIGDAIGDVGMARRMIEKDKADRLEAIQDAAKGETSPDTPTAAAPPTILPSVPAESSADTPQAPARPDIQPSPDLAYTPPAQQPSGILSPSMPTGLQRAQSSREQISSLLSGQPMARLPGLPGAAQAAPGAIPTADPDAGGYNMIDAQAGQTPPNVAPRAMRPGVMDAIQRNITNPDMQAQAATMHMREQPPGGRDVSPAGAAGPYGFMAATGRDYGMNTQAEREDLDLSTKGFERFTQDNAARFEQRMGRPPTRQELAVMHQQGAGGGMGLLAGRPVAAANARGNNLPIGNAAGQLAAINRFYGQPNTPIGSSPVPATDMSALSRQTDPRARVADALVNQGAPPPAPAPAPAPGPGGAMAGQPTLAAQMAPGALPGLMERPAPPTPPPASPPAAQVAQAPRPPAQGIQPMARPGVPVPTYGPGYITPTPPEVQPPPTLGPTRRERELEVMVRTDPNELRAGNNAARLKLLQEDRARQQKQLDDQYAKDVAHRNSILLKIEEQKGRQHQDVQESIKRDYDNRDASAPKVQQNIQDGHWYDAQKGVWRKPIFETMPNGDADPMPQVKVNGDEGKAQMFHAWTSLAQEQMEGHERILAEGLQQELAGKIPFFGNKIQEAAYRRVRSAAERFIQGFLRDTSGAAIGPEELMRHTATFIPKYGDDAATIAQKRQARELVIQGEYARAGQGRQISDWQKRQRDAKRARIDREMTEKGVERIPGYEYKNKDGTKRRVWTGRFWEESD